MLSVAVLAIVFEMPPPSADPSTVEFFRSKPLARLRSAGEVKAHRVDNFLPPGPKAPPDAESLHMAGIFRVRRAARVLPPEDAAVLRTTLRSESSYESYVSGCMFEPGVAFTLPSRDDLLVLVCFKCEEVAFVKGRTTLRKFSLSQDGKAALWRLSVKVFPELKTPDSKTGPEKPAGADKGVGSDPRVRN